MLVQMLLTRCGGADLSERTRRNQEHVAETRRTPRRAELRCVFIGLAACKTLAFSGAAQKRVLVELHIRSQDSRVYFFKSTRRRKAPSGIAAHK